MTFSPSHDCIGGTDALGLLRDAGCSMMLLPTFVPSFLSGQGHIRLTYFGQWSEVEPRCSQEAVDRLYSAPGKMGVRGDSWISGALVWVKDRGRAGATRMPTERKCVFLFSQRSGALLS